MKIVTVIPFKRGVLKEEFTYFSAQNIENGDIVNIPMRNTKNLGLVVSSSDVAKEKSNIKNMSFNLKKIDEVKEKSIFKKEFIESLMLTSQYFASKKNLVISSLITNIFIEEYNTIVKDINLENKNNNLSKIKKEKLLFQASIEERINFYKTLIRSSFAEKKSVFIVLPTEKDIENFHEFLSKGIENFTFSIHGNFSKKKQLEKIQNILKLDHPVLIFGTAPYLAIPRNDFKTIILEHESSNAYKTIKKPIIDLRIFTEILASKFEAKLILADSFLRFETIARKEIDDLGEIHLSFKKNFSGNIKIIDKKTDGKFKILNEKTLEEIKNNLNKNKNIFVYSLRKGLATMTLCRDCGESISCPKCLAPVVLYQNRKTNKNIFVCNKCEEEFKTETTCPKCDSWNLIPLGIGTDTIYEEIKKNFEHTKIFKLDKEVIKTAKEAEKLITEYEENTGSILIGTEIAFSYVKEKIPLTIIASFDALWSIPNFKMSERIIQIILSLISKTKETLIIETKNTEDEIINAIKLDNLLSFVREELKERKKLNYPPFKKFIKISFIGNREENNKVRNFISENFKEYEIEIFSGFIEKLKDKFITNALIKINPKDWSLPEISHNGKIDEILLEKLISLPPNFTININPDNLI